MLKRILKSDYFITTILYSLVHGLILFNDGLFWDGWASFYHTSETGYLMFREMGGEPLRYVISHLILFENGVFLLRIITFFSFLFSALLFYRILININEIDRFSRLIIVLFFALFPINEARISIATSLYSLSYGLFFLGFWLVCQYCKTNKYIFRVISLPIFFLSFTTNSFLVFYLIPVLFIFYLDKIESFSILEILKKVYSYADFVILPIIYWILKQNFFQSSGLYGETYNIVSLTNIMLSPIKTIGVLYSSFIITIFDSLSYGNLIIIFAPFIYFIFNKYEDTTSTTVNNMIFLLLGLMAFYLSVFPYLAVGRDGLGYGVEWANRDELLIPLGAAFILYYGIKVIANEFEMNRKFQNLFYSILITSFILFNFNNYVEFQRDWFKQLSIIENFKSSDIIINNTSFLFDDQTYKLNAIDRWYRFYEYSGLMKLTFGYDNRFGENHKAFIKFGGKNKIQDYASAIASPIYNISNFILIPPQYKITIKEGTYKPSLLGTLRTLIYKWTNTIKFQSRIGNIVTFEFQKL